MARASFSLGRGSVEPVNFIARDLINKAGSEFLVFPTTDGAIGYRGRYQRPAADPA